MKNISKTFIVSSLLIPLIANAQLGGIGALIDEARLLVGSLLIPLLGGLALAVFFWGLVKFIFAQGSETAKSDAKKVMVWGLIALFVMFSVWGIIQFFQDAFLGGADFGAPSLDLLN